MSGTKGYDEGVFLMLSPHLYVAALLDVTSKLALFEETFCSLCADAAGSNGWYCHDQ